MRHAACEFDLARQLLDLTKEERMKRHAIWIALSIVALVGGAQAQPPGVFVYPQKGQDQAKQDVDNAECMRWAKGQSGVDPNAAAAPPDRGKRVGGALRGGAKGAAAGAAVGAIAGDAGKGAAIGAAAGGIGGRRKAKQDEQAAAAGQEDAFKRAFGACMEGRGYSVK
jgi:hypothetical protein